MSTPVIQSRTFSLPVENIDTDQLIPARFMSAPRSAGYGGYLLHDARFEYLRLYPPGSQIPGMDEAEDQAYSGSLRSRLSQAEVALLLVTDDVRPDRLRVEDEV